MSRMHNPPHPGEVMKELCLELTVTAAAEASASRAVPCGRCSTVMREFPPTWQFACPKGSAARRRAGYSFSSNMSFGRPSNDPARSR
jgi:hypothetical protein